ncbi:MAG: energy transducer TonB [Gemmatimonadota bacterium]|nr:energy transducer TonB [Gemmatimonadota bacterium]
MTLHSLHSDEGDPRRPRALHLRKFAVLVAWYLAACVTPPPGEGGPVATGSPAPAPTPATTPVASPPPASSLPPVASAPPTVSPAPSASPAPATSPAIKTAADAERCPKGVLPPGGEELRPYFGYEVDRKAELIERWPTPIRAPGREGAKARVNVMFLVDTTGLVVPGTATLVASSGPLDTRAVCDALSLLRYRPARLTGRLVRMWDQHEFRF